ncbi:10274_t:CDS:1, partial [Gigaspora rosea]
KHLTGKGIKMYGNQGSSGDAKNVHCSRKNNNHNMSINKGNCQLE